MGNTPVSEQEIRNSVRSLIAEVTERIPEEISDTAVFEDELEIDSLMALEMMVALDKKYNIDIPEEEFTELKNVNETVAAILRHHYCPVKSRIESAG